MFLMLMFTAIYVSPSNPRLLGNLLGFSGCLLLDPLRFGSCHLLVIRRWVKEISFHCLRPLIPCKFYLSKGMLGVRFYSQKKNRFGK